MIILDLKFRYTAVSREAVGKKDKSICADLER